jgi:peptidyl-prolyl cis-trans isomerase C
LTHSWTRRSLTTVLVTLGMAATAPVWAADNSASAPTPLPNATVATVNGTALSELLVGIAVEEAQGRGATDSPALRDALVNELIRTELLAQRAKQEGLDQQPDVAARMALANASLLARAFQRDWAQKNQPSNADLKAEYERQVRELKKRAPLTEFALAHIVVASEETARSIIEQLSAGSDFAALAAAQSIEPQTRDNGGDMGWVLPFNILPEIGNVIVNLDKGEVAQSPIRTRLGWHVVKVGGKRPYQIPTYESSLNALRQAVQTARWNTYFNGLVEQAKIQR